MGDTESPDLYGYTIFVLFCCWVEHPNGETMYLLDVTFECPLWTSLLEVPCGSPFLTSLLDVIFEHHFWTYVWTSLLDITFRCHFWTSHFKITFVCLFWSKILDVTFRHHFKTSLLNCVYVDAFRGLAPCGAGWHNRWHTDRTTSRLIDWIGLDADSVKICDNWFFIQYLFWISKWNFEWPQRLKTISQSTPLMKMKYLFFSGWKWPIIFLVHTLVYTSARGMLFLSLFNRYIIQMDETK